MAGTGSVKVTIDDEKIKERMREFLAKAWEEGRDHGRDNSRDGFCLCTDDGWAEADKCVNPYRSEQ